MLPRPPALRALLGAVAHPAVVAFAAAIGVAGVLAAIVLGSTDPTDPARPTPVGTAILAPSDRELGLLQTPTPQPTRIPAETEIQATASPTEASGPQPTPTPRVVLAPTALPRPTTVAPTAESTAPPAESTVPAAEVAQAVETTPSPTPLPNVRVTPSPTPPPAPTADLPPPQVLQPVDLAPEPTRSPRQDPPPATEEAEADPNRPAAEETRRDAPPTPTAIRIVPGGPPGRAAEPAAAAVADVDGDGRAGDLGDEIEARVTGALSGAGIAEGNGRGNRPVGLPVQTAEPDQPRQTVVLPPIASSGSAPRVGVPTPQPPAIVPRNPRPRSRPPAADRPAAEVPLPPAISPRQPGQNRSPVQPGGRGNDDEPMFPDCFPFCD